MKTNSNSTFPKVYSKTGVILRPMRSFFSHPHSLRHINRITYCQRQLLSVATPTWFMQISSDRGQCTYMVVWEKPSQPSQTIQPVHVSTCTIHIVTYQWNHRLEESWMNQTKSHTGEPPDIISKSNIRHVVTENFIYWASRCQRSVLH